MKVYTVTKHSHPDSRIDNDYLLTEHDSDAFIDPISRVPIGRLILARGLTYQEATDAKHALDLAQGTAPIQILQNSLRNCIPPDAKPATTKIFLPNGKKAS